VVWYTCEVWCHLWTFLCYICHFDWIYLSMHQVIKCNIFSLCRWGGWYDNYCNPYHPHIFRLFTFRLPTLETGVSEINHKLPQNFWNWKCIKEHRVWNAAQFMVVVQWLGWVGWGGGILKLYCNVCSYFLRIILKWTCERLDGGAWTGSMWLRIGTGGELLWIRLWTFGFHKMRKISWVA
jgi:hypothetical protein